MGILTDVLREAGRKSAIPSSDGAGVGKINEREQAIIDRHASEALKSSLFQKKARRDAQKEIESRRQQRAYAEQAPPEVSGPVKEMLSNLDDRTKVRSIYQKLTPEQRQEALRLVPGISQQLGDDRGGTISRAVGALRRGVSTISQPAVELADKVIGTDWGGTPEEIAFIRQMEAAKAQEFAPALPSDPWYERYPLQALEMVPFSAATIGGGAVGGAVGKAGGGLLARGAAAGVPGARGVMQAAGAVGRIPTAVGLPAMTAQGVGTVAGITAVGFPGQYAQEIDQLKELGVEDGPGMQALAVGTSLVSSALEAIMPNPFKGVLPAGKVAMMDGATKAARQYLWEAVKRAPPEMTEEYAQGLASGLGKTVASWLDMTTQDVTLGDAFATSFEQGNAAIGPMAFLLGVPAAGGAAYTAFRARGGTPPGPPPVTQAPPAGGQVVVESPAVVPTAAVVQDPQQLLARLQVTLKPKGDGDFYVPKPEFEKLVKDGIIVDDGKETNNRDYRKNKVNAKIAELQQQLSSAPPVSQPIAQQQPPPQGVPDASQVPTNEGSTNAQGYGQEGSPIPVGSEVRGAGQNQVSPQPTSQVATAPQVQQVAPPTTITQEQKDASQVRSNEEIALQGQEGDGRQGGLQGGGDGGQGRVSQPTIQETAETQVQVSDVDSVRAAMASAPIGVGGNAWVYGIDDTRVVRVPKHVKDVTGEFTPVEHPLTKRGLRVGQAIAKNEQGVEILQRQSGSEAGLALPSGNQAQDDAQYARAIEDAASLPQEAYDEFADTLKALDEAGYQFDPSKSNNVLIDTKAGKFNLVDVNESKSGKPQASLEYMLIPLIGNTYAHKFKGESLEAPRKEIARKATEAARKANINLELGSSGKYSLELAGEVSGVSQPPVTPAPQQTEAAAEEPAQEGGRWVEVPNDAVLEPGKEIRLDIEKGKTYVWEPTQEVTTEPKKRKGKTAEPGQILRDKDKAAEKPRPEPTGEQDTGTERELSGNRTGTEQPEAGGPTTTAEQKKDGKPKPNRQQFTDTMVKSGIIRAEDAGKKSYAFTFRDRMPQNRWLAANEIADKLRGKDARGWVAKSLRPMVDAGLITQMFRQDGTPVYAWDGTEPTGELVTAEQFDKSKKPDRIQQIQDAFPVSLEVAIVADILADVTSPPGEVKIAPLGTPIPGDAVTQISKAAAKMKAEGKTYSSESTFFEMWDKFLRAVGGKRLSLKSTRRAVEEAVEDIASWIEANPQYLNYYAKDMQAERDSLAEIHPELRDDANWALFKVISGIASNNAPLEGNVTEQINAYASYAKDGRIDATAERSETGRGEWRVGHVGFTLYGGAQGVKALHYQTLNTIIKQQGGAEGAVTWLMGRVKSTPSGMEAARKSVGLGPMNGSNIAGIKTTVEAATGQREEVPRAFAIFGPKVGAYVLNHLGQSEYTTVDVWESRFWRSFFKDVSASTGLEEDTETRAAFIRAANAFAEMLGLSPSAAQAARWFYVIQKMKEAGYTYAREKDRVSVYTAREVAKRQNTQGADAGRKRKTAKPGAGRKSSALRSLIGGTIFGEEVAPDTLYQGQARTRRIDMNFKDVTKRIPELQDAARLLKDGKLSKEGYAELVDEFKPVVPYSFVPEPATAQDAERALSSSKQKAFGNTSETIPAGTKVELRLDIPAYKDHGVWINSIHHNVDGNRVTSYDSYSAATDIDFRQSEANQRKALGVATGEARKSPFAVIKGKWNPISKDDAVERSKEALNSREWVQVGYDPERHSYFYDRSTMELLESADEVIQIGPLVLARNPVYGQTDDALFQKQRDQQGTIQAWTHFIGASKALIGATDKADVSSFFHEWAHPLRKFLFNRDVSQENRGDITDDDIQKIEDFVGVKYDADGNPIWGRDEEEKFVDALMSYWIEGKAPKDAPDLETVFQKISVWLSKVFSVIQRKVPLNDEVRAVFDKVHRRGGVDPKKLQALKEAEATAEEVMTDEPTVAEEAADLVGDIFGLQTDETDKQLADAGITIKKTKTGWSVKGISDEQFEAIRKDFDGRRGGKSGSYFFSKDPTQGLLGAAEENARESQLTAEAEAKGLVRTNVGNLKPEAAEWYENTRAQRIGVLQEVRSTKAARIAELLGHFVKPQNRGMFAIKVKRAAEAGDYDSILKFDEMAGVGKITEGELFDLLQEKPLTDEEIEAQVDSELAWELDEAAMEAAGDLAIEEGDDSFDFGEDVQDVQIGFEGMEDQAAEIEKRDSYARAKAARKDGPTSKGKQKPLFDTSGDKDQMTFLDDGITPEDRVYRPESTNQFSDVASAAKAIGADQQHRSVQNDVLRDAGPDGKYKFEPRPATEKQLGNEEFQSMMKPIPVGQYFTASTRAQPKPPSTKGSLSLEAFFYKVSDTEAVQVTNASYIPGSTVNGWTAELNKRNAPKIIVKPGDTLFQAQKSDKRLVAELAKQFIDEGGKTFDGYVKHVANKMTKEQALDLSEYLEEIWKQIRKLKAYSDLPEAGNVAAILAEKPEPAKPEKPKLEQKPKQPEKPVEKPTSRFFPRVPGVRKPGQPSPEAEPEPYEPHELTGMAKAVMNDLRELAGIPELEAAPPETIEQWALDAQSTMAADQHAATRLLNDIIANPDRALDHHDVMLLAFRYRALVNEAEPHFQELKEANASGNAERIAQARTNYILARKPVTEFEELTLKAKSTWGRTGIALQVLLRRDNTVAGLLRRAREANHGKPLTPEQEIEIRDLADRFAAVQKKLDEALARADKAEAEVASLRHLKELVKESPTRKRPSKEQKLELDKALGEIAKLANVNLLFQRDATNPYHNAVQMYRDLGVETFSELRKHFQERFGKEQAAKLEEQLKKAWEATKPETEVPANIDRGNLAQLTREARRIERSIVEGLLLDHTKEAVIEMRDEIVNAVHAEMQELLDESFTHRQTMDALSGYGQFSRPSQDTTDTLLRNLNAEVLKLRQIDQLGDAVARVDQLRANNKEITDAEIADILIKEGLLVAQTGLVRDTPSDRLRDLNRQYNEKKKDIPASSEGRAGLLQTAVAAIERGLSNRIRDLNHALSQTPPEPIKIGRKPSPTNPNIERLREERDALLKEYRKLFPAEKKKLTPEQRLANAIKAAERSIEVLEKQIATRNFDKQEQEGLPESPELTELRERLEHLRDQRNVAKALELSQWESEGGAVGPDPKEAAYRKAYIASLSNRIAKLQQFMREGDFSPKENKKSPRILSKEEIDLKTKLAELNTEKLKKMADYHLSHLKGIAWAADKISEVLHLARAVETMADLSAMGKQGGLIALGRPALAKNALVGVIKSMAQAFDKSAIFNKQDLKLSELEQFLTGIDSRKAELAFMHQLTDGEWGEFRQLAELDLPSTDQAITRQEEAFAGRWGKYFPGVAISSRLYTMILNKMRADMFDMMVDNLGRQKKITLEEAKLIAHFVNVMTGRSDLKQFNSHAATLNNVFFAPRYVASRFQYLAMPFYLPFKGGVKANWQIKRAIYGEYARTARGAVLTLGLIAIAGYLFWDDDDEDKPTVGFDPTTSDFLKPKFGETRLDFLAGLQQVFVLSARMLPEELGGGRIGDKKYGEGGPYAQSRATVLARFLRTKLAPGPGYVTTGLNDWENVIGEKADSVFGIKVHPAIGTTTNLFWPLSMQSVADAFETQPVPVAAGASILSILGVGMSTYGPKTEYMTGTPEERQKQIDGDLENLEWDAPNPPYSEFLTKEQLDQFAKRRTNRVGLKLSQAISDPESELGKKTRDKALELIKESKRLGRTRAEAIKAYMDYWQENNKKNGRKASTHEIVDGSRVMKAALKKGINKVKALYRD